MWHYTYLYFLLIGNNAAYKRYPRIRGTECKKKTCPGHTWARRCPRVLPLAATAVPLVMVPARTPSTSLAAASCSLCVQRPWAGARVTTSDCSLCCHQNPLDGLSPWLHVFPQLCTHFVIHLGFRTSLSPPMPIWGNKRCLHTPPSYSSFSWCIKGLVLL